jgi:alpha-L-fucosidase
MRMLREGDPHGPVWRPGETDVSIRPGWFYHPAEDARVRSVDDLVNLYFTSVGRNSKLLLNVPPTREGLLHDVDVERLSRMRAALTSLFGWNLAASRRATWRRTDRTAALDVDLGAVRRFSIVDLREPIARGQHVARFRVIASDAPSSEGRVIAAGTTIGYRRLLRLDAPVSGRFVRVTVDEAVAAPERLTLGLYA